MKKYYDFAGVEVCISIPEQWMYDDEKILEDFRVSQVKNPHKYEFEIVKNLEEPDGELIAAFSDYLVYKKDDVQIRYIGNVKQGWKDAYIRIYHYEKNHFVQLKAGKYIDKVSVKLVLNSLNLEYLLMSAESLILHASYIEMEGKAILFTAPSGTGKSTQAELWKKHRQAVIINGDRVVIKPMDKEIYAVGIPFAGSSQYCKNKILPIAAIVYIKQDLGNTVVELKGLKGFRKIWEGCTVNSWDPASVDKTADLVQRIIGNVPIYQLNCTPDERAVIALEEMLKNEC